MDLSRTAAVLRRRWPLLVLVIFLGLGAGAAKSLTATPTYRSTTSVFLSLQRGDTVGELAQGSAYLQGLVQSYADVAKSRIVLEPVVAKQKLSISPSALASQVSAQARPNTSIIDISATGSSPTQASRIAGAVGAELRQAASTLAPQSYGAAATVTVTTISPPSLPTAPSTPRTTRDLILGLFGGIALGAILVAVTEALTSPVDNREIARSATGAPVLASVPRDRAARSRPIPVVTDPTSARTEAFWVLRANLQLQRPIAGPMVLVVTSALPREGRTSVAVNLAAAMSHAERRVLLVDGDLRHPGVARMLGLPGAKRDRKADRANGGGPDAAVADGGLATVLSGETALEDVTRTWVDPDTKSSVRVLPAGRSAINPSELIASDAMTQLIRTMKSRYDLIVIDTGPLLRVADGAILAARADGALLVVDSRTHRRHLTEAVTRLQLAGAQLLGVALNRGPGGAPPVVGNAAAWQRESIDANEETQQIVQTGPAD
jgi:succinoglycan biosynthesis transport protein ExoP